MKIFPKTKRLFCKEYWRNTKNKAANNYVEWQGTLCSVNRKLLTGEGFSLQEFKEHYGISLDKLILQTDHEFKRLKKTKKEMVVYRGIAKPNENAHPLLKKLYEKSLNLKANEKTRVRGYTFAAFDRDFAEMFFKIRGKSGILFEITIPKNAQVSTRWDEVVTRRCSEFLCTESKEASYDKANYTIKKMRYIIPKDNHKNWFRRLFCR